MHNAESTRLIYSTKRRSVSRVSVLVDLVSKKAASAYSMGGCSSAAATGYTW
jgi:hypothetical protein